MIPMITSLLREKISKWGAVQHAQYYRALGSYQKIGIELEVSGKIPLKLPVEDVKRLLLANDILFSWGGELNPYEDYEIQILFEVSDPLHFTYQLKRFVQVLNCAGIITVGGTHVNLQAKIKSKRHYLREEDIKIRDRLKYMHMYLHRKCVDFTTARTEWKKGYVWTTWKELFCTILIGANPSMDHRHLRCLESIIKPRCAIYTSKGLNP